MLDWVWPPDVILRQDEALMSDLLRIESWYQKVKEQERDAAK